MQVQEPFADEEDHALDPDAMPLEYGEDFGEEEEFAEPQDLDGQEACVKPTRNIGTT